MVNPERFPPYARNKPRNARVGIFFRLGTMSPYAQKTSRTEQIESALPSDILSCFRLWTAKRMLESQFTNEQIQARDFVRGLLLSKKFKNGFPINVK